MFCKNCGSKNPEGSLYCMNDGYPLLENSHQLAVGRDGASFCKSCSQKNGTDANYCIACGVSLEKVMEKAGGSASTASSPHSRPSSGPIAEGISSVFSVSSMFQASKYSLIAIGVLLLFSFFSAAAVNNRLRGFFAQDVWMEDLVSMIKFVSTTDMMMLSHLTGVTYSVSALFLEANLITSGWVGIFALNSAVGLVLAGYLINRKEPERTAIERIYAIVPVVIIYSLLTCLISTFAGISMDIPDPSGFLEGITISASYPFVDVLLNSLILSTIFTTIGSMIGLKPHLKGLGGNIRFGISIQRAALHTVLGIAICMVLTLFVVGSKADVKELKEEAGEESFLVDFFLIQAGTYMWNLTHMGSLKFEMNAYDESIGAKYSILGGPKASGSEVEESMELAYNLKQVIGSLWYFLLIPVLLHAWAGMVILKSTSGQILYETVAYAIAFGLVNTAIYHLLNLSIDTSFSGLFDMSFGFSLPMTMLYSTLIAFGITYVTASLMKNRTQAQTYQEYQKVSSY